MVEGHLMSEGEEGCDGEGHLISEGGEGCDGEGYLMTDGVCGSTFTLGCGNALT